MLARRHTGGARRTPGAAAWLLAVALVALTGCGSTLSSSSAVERARLAGSAEARREDELAAVRERVNKLEHSRTIPAAADPILPAAGGVQLPSATIGRIPASGTYTGEATQRGTPAAVNKDFPLEMTFSHVGSSVNYPTLGCSGRLAPRGFEGVNRVYIETIEAGTCDTGGAWDVTVLGPREIYARWHIGGRAYTVQVALRSP